MSFFLTRFRKKLNEPALAMSAEEQEWWKVERRSQARRAMLRSILPTVGLVGASFFVGHERLDRPFRASDLVFMALMSAIFIGGRWFVRATELESSQPDLIAAHRLREELLRPDSPPTAASRSLDGDHVA